MASNILLRTWISYIDQLKGASQAWADVIADLESDTVDKIELEKVATAMMKVGYRSTVGFWDALIAALGPAVPVASIPSTGKKDAVVPIYIEDYKESKLSGSNLYFLGDPTGKTNPTEIEYTNHWEAKVDRNELQVKITTNLAFEPGDYLGSVLYSGKTVALVATRRL